MKIYHDKVSNCDTVPKKIFHAVINGRNVFMSGMRCITHKLDVCRCGVEFGKHYEKTNKHEDYEEFIKDYCMMCKKGMVKSWKRYEEDGNYCSSCNAEITRRFEKKKKRKN